MENESFGSLLNALISKDSKQISIKAAEFKCKDKILQEKINSLGKGLKRIGNESEILKRKWPSINESAARLVRSAQVNENYKPFNKSDSSSMAKAIEQREAARKLTFEFKKNTETLKEEEDTIIAGIYSEISKAEKLNEFRDANINSKLKTIGSLKDFNIFPELQSSPISMLPRGPTVHGLQLGMSYDDFFGTLNSAYPSSMRLGFTNRDISIGDLIRKPNTLVKALGFVANKNERQIGVPIYNKVTRENIGIAATTFVAAGPSKNIIYFSLERPILQKLFSLDSLSYDEFCQKFIDIYSIPELKGKQGSFGSVMSYVSSAGWKVTFVGDDYQRGIASVHFLAVPSEAESGFGK